MAAPLERVRLPEAESMPLDTIHVDNPRLRQDDAWQLYFARLRRATAWRITARQASMATIGR